MHMRIHVVPVYYLGILQRQDLCCMAVARTALHKYLLIPVLSSSRGACPHFTHACERRNPGKLAVALLCLKRIR